MAENFKDSGAQARPEAREMEVVTRAVTESLRRVEENTDSITALNEQIKALTEELAELERQIEEEEAETSVVGHFRSADSREPMIMLIFFVLVYIPVSTFIYIFFFL